MQTLKDFFLKILLKSERQSGDFPEVAFHENITVNIYLNIISMFKVKINLTRKIIVAFRRSWFGYFSFAMQTTCSPKLLQERVC